MTRKTPNYREMLRLKSEGFSQQQIADSVGSSKKTVNRVLKLAAERQIAWPLPPELTNVELARLLGSPPRKTQTDRRMPDFDLVHKQLLRNGVNKKLLWTEYVENCRLSGEQWLMYSQFCYYIQQDEMKRRATMHLSYRPGERIEVDWAGDPAYYTDPDTGERIAACVFVGVLAYSQYTFVKAYRDEKQNAWLQAHVDMYEFFGGVSKALVPDNCATAVVHTRNWFTPKLNASYHELAEHYGTGILPARVRRPRDKSTAEGNVGHTSTWVIAALRDGQFFSLAELNEAIAEKLEAYNHRPFQKKDGSRYELYRDEEKPALKPLPEFSYEVVIWKKAKVQYNYHVSVEGMLYSVPYAYIHKVVDVRLTDYSVEIYCEQSRIASHSRLRGRKGQYATNPEHMPENHQKYLEWNGDRFRKWAEKTGPNTRRVVDGILSSHRLEQQGYRACMGLLKLGEQDGYLLEEACRQALTYSPQPTYKTVKNLMALLEKQQPQDRKTSKARGLTRGAEYYGRKRHE